jgi:hypothetical protein
MALNSDPGFLYCKATTIAFPYLAPEETVGFSVVYPALPVKLIPDPLKDDQIVLPCETAKLKKAGNLGTIQYGLS